MMERIRYRRINTKGLWENFEACSDNLSVENGSLQLKTHWIYEFGKVLFEDKRVTLTDVAVDECNNLYIADSANNVILRLEGYTGTVRAMGCKPGILPIALKGPSGVAVDRDSIYVCDGGNDRLVALARTNLQIRWILSVKSPSDLAVSGRETLYVLEAGNKRILRVSMGGNREGSIDLGASAQPTAVAVHTTGELYVLDQKTVRIFGQSGAEEKPPIPIEFTPSGLSIDKAGNMFVGQAGPDDPHKTLYRIDPDGKATPLWSYRGASRRLVNDSKGNLYVINSEGDRLTFLRYKRANVPDTKGLFRGFYTSRALDSGILGTRWHRFLLEGQFTRGTQVDFFYYASDHKLSDDLVRKEDHPWYRGVGEGGRIQGEEKRDALFHERKEGIDLMGRYLYLKFVLSGTESLSPVVSSLTVFFPRITYLRYLPALYQKDPASRSFLERFLSLFESIFAEYDFSIEHLTRFFDAIGTPAEFLPWLASWLSLMVDENWPDKKKRLFIQKAPELYKKRGTRVGLEETLDLYLGGGDGSAEVGGKPYYIVEHLFMDRPVEDGTPVGAGEEQDALFYPPAEAKVNPNDGYGEKGQGCRFKEEVKEATPSQGGEEEGKMPLSTALFGKERFSFCVFVRKSILKDINLETVRKLIEEQKPAHTCYGVQVLEPWLYLDMHTYLGVNTALTKPVFILGEQSVIGRDTVLDDGEKAGQIGRRARAGMDTKLT